MKIVYKKERLPYYEACLQILRHEFPHLKFRIKTKTVMLDEFYEYTKDIGIELRLGFCKWQELDLDAMGLTAEFVYG